MLVFTEWVFFSFYVFFSQSSFALPSFSLCLSSSFFLVKSSSLSPFFASYYLSTITRHITQWRLFLFTYFSFFLLSFFLQYFFSFPLLYFIFCPSLSLSHTLSLHHNVHLNSIYSPLLYLPFYFRQLRLLGEEQRALVHKHEHGRCRSSDIINKFMFEFELKSWRNAEKSRRGS